MLVGYARVSTLDQTLDLQQDALRKIGCEQIFTDTASGAKTDRAGLEEALHFVRAGDMLVFSMFTVHTSLDNHSDRIRISSDTRYQLASEPVDERWVGENPPAHGPSIKQGMIC